MKLSDFELLKTIDIAKSIVKKDKSITVDFKSSKRIKVSGKKSDNKYIIFLLWDQFVEIGKTINKPPHVIYNRTLLEYLMQKQDIADSNRGLPTISSTFVIHCLLVRNWFTDNNEKIDGLSPLIEKPSKIHRIRPGRPKDKTVRETRQGIRKDYYELRKTRKKDATLDILEAKYYWLERSTIDDYASKNYD